jgi:putative transposase
LDVKKRFSEEQIIGFLREADKGVPVKELCRKHGFSEASYYLWRSKFGGMDVSDARRLKALEAENAKLKKLLAEALLENEVTKEALRKNGARPGTSRAGAVDASARDDGAALSGDRRHEREFAALPAAAGPQRGSENADRHPGAAASALRRRDDPPEASAGRRACELQAGRAAVSA